MKRGKKIGALVVRLDRKKDRYHNAEVTTDLRFELSSGTFFADYEGKTYEAKSKDALSDQIKAVATKSLSFEWTRYIFIDYEATGWPLEDEKAGRPETSGRYTTFKLDDNRGKANYDEKSFVVCGIDLHWSLADVSDPYPLPESPGKLVRSCRSVDIWDHSTKRGQERLGDPNEWKDAKLPVGTVPWTPEREMILAEVLRALGKLDARMVELFRGSGDDLAKRLDAAAQTDTSRLLAAPPDDTETAPRRARSRSGR